MFDFGIFFSAYLNLNQKMWILFFGKNSQISDGSVYFLIISPWNRFYLLLHHSEKPTSYSNCFISIKSKNSNKIALS